MSTVMSEPAGAPAAARPFFAPRRLGHANVFVSDYERAFDFYHDVVGFEEVYRQPDNRASFISNGNTYHDMALTDVRSKYAPAGQAPGLFHIAFEVANEAELVESYRRAVSGSVRFDMTQDHDVAHSLYLTDPDGNGVELYADVVEDWRSARNGIIVKKKPEWIPGVTTVPVAASLHPKDPEIRVVSGSVFRARRVTHVGFVTGDHAAQLDYYTRVVGLRPFAGGADDAFVVLRGAASTGDVTLYRREAGDAVGLHHIGIEVTEADLDRARAELPAAGLAVAAELDHPARRVLCVRDPDGLLLQFYANLDWRPETLRGLTRAQALALL